MLRTVMCTWLSCLAGLVGCAATPPDAAPSQFLDPQTAATLWVVSTPLVFARERPDVAANVRDYATLSTVAVNRSGDMRYYWIVYFWSTLDERSRMSVGQWTTSGDPLLLADDRRLVLGKRVESTQAAGISLESHRPPGVQTEPKVYATTADMLRFVSASRQLRLLPSDDPAELPYDLWRDARPALRGMVNSN